MLKQLFWTSMGIFCGLIILMGIMLSGNMYMGNDYRYADEIRDYKIDEINFYGQAYELNYIYYNIFFGISYKFLDYYKNISEHEPNPTYTGCALGYAHYVYSDERSIDNFNFEPNLLINSKPFGKKIDGYEYDTDSAGRTCDDPFYTAIIIARNGKCAFTSQEINEYVTKVKSDNKKYIYGGKRYMVLMCNSTEILVATPFYPQGELGHLTEEGYYKNLEKPRWS